MSLADGIDSEDRSYFKRQSDPSRTIMIEQLMYAGGGGRKQRDEYEAMTDKDLRNEWNFLIGYLME